MKICMICDQHYMGQSCAHCGTNISVGESKTNGVGTMALLGLLGLPLMTACGDKEDTGTAVEAAAEPAMEPTAEPDMAMDYGVPDTGYVDNDGDGWTIADGDCDDDNPDIHPDAEEVEGDGVDSNCNSDDDT